MFKSLAPVRRAVPLRRGTIPAGRATARAKFAGREVMLLGSGTEALAVAIALSCERRAVNEPEVILPAYGCPDLVSACTAAGVRARLVDVRASTWGYDIQALEAAVSKRTVAIVAVNLLGAGDDAEVLAPLARAANVTLIQDSAQDLRRGVIDVRGDYFVLSFGRGKPLNLLRGGALVRPADETGEPSGLPGGVRHSSRGLRQQLLSSRFGAVAFNLLSSPPVYHWISRLPGTGLGATMFHPLHDVTKLDERAWAQLDYALRAFDAKPSYDWIPWAGALDEWRSYGLSPLTAASETLPRELLRLPLILSRASLRDGLVRALWRAGLGASTMYGVALNRLPGVPGEISFQGPFQNADGLAARLLTLPTHSGVTARTVARARQIVREVLKGA